MSFGLQKSKIKSYLTKQPSSNLGKDYPDASSYYQGWVHYYHYPNHITNWRPKKFYKNNAYFAQRLPMSTIKRKDKHGLKMIPNKTSFFVVVNKKGIHMFSSRVDTIKTQIDSLLIRFIKPIPEDNYLKGGVHNLGTFKIGHCFEIKAEVPDGQNPESDKIQNTTWVFCLDDPKEKGKLMKVLIKLKLQQQRKLGKFETSDSVKSAGKKNNLGGLLNKKVEKREPAKGPPQDGYWLLLQDWSPCSVKCGGGESFQQWQCVPPKKGGKPCKGKSIRVKKCNTTKCPGVSAVKSMQEKTKQEIKKPVVQIAPFSNRLQRFDKCVIKENDAFLTEFNKKNKAKNKKMPVRILMNNSTLTIYKDDEYTNIHHSFDLEKTSFMILKGTFCCFNIKDAIMSSNLCGYEKFCGKPKDNKWANDWSDDFKIFKTGCKVGKMDSLLSPDDEKELAEALRKKLGQSSASSNANKEEEIKQQMLQSNAKSSPYVAKVEKTQNAGLKAIQKEMQLEDLIRNEEKEKEEEEIASIVQRIKEEKEKAECLTTNIKARDLDASIIADKRSAESEIKELKVEAVKEIKAKRAKIKKIISMMRAKAKIRKSKYQQELQSLRNKMAMQQMKANKVGDIKWCRKGKLDRDYREKYCDKNFIDDFINNRECKTDEFCYMCCETEFGNMHIDKREKCYNMCDIKEKNNSIKKEKAKEKKEIKKKKSLPDPFMWQ